MIYLIFILQVIIGLLIYIYLPSYIKEKGKNLATKEDIGKITKEVEKVKTDYKKQYDLSVAEKEFYDHMVAAIQGFLADIKAYELESGLGENSVSKDVVMNSPELRKKWIEFVDLANEILAKAFVFLNEKSYEQLKNVFQETRSFADLRYNLLDSMRLSIYPDTKFKAKEDSRDIKYS